MGTGESTLFGGSGSEVAQFVAGQAGGMDFLYGFNPAEDTLLLSGYGQTAADAAAAGQYDIGGNSWLKLSDGTVIAFVGLSHFSTSNLAVS
jgi:hypothetical protein